MKKAQQEDLIISELVENIENIKIVDVRGHDASGNIYALNNFFIYRKDTINHKFVCYLIFVFSSLCGLIPVRVGDYIACIALHSISIMSLCYYYLYKHNTYVYTYSKFIKQFSRKNQKQIRSIIIQVETKNILNSIEN